MPIPCAQCSTSLPEWELAAGGQATCGECSATNIVRAYPALLEQRQAVQAESAVEGEAACFDHPAKKAVAACQQCGRYVCQLCAVEFEGVVRCPACAAGGVAVPRNTQEVTRRTLYDSIALTIPLAALIMWPLTIIAAPASLVVSIAKWRQPLSLVRRSRWRFVLAILIDLAQIAFWILIIVLMLRGLATLGTQRRS